MTETPAIRPAGKVAGPTHASARAPVAKTFAAKPALARKPAKPAAKKSAAPFAKPVSGGHAATKLHDIPASILKRKATPARRRAAEPAAVGSDDSAARAAIGKQARGRRTAADAAGDPPKASGMALVERVTRAVERELSQIEAIVGDYHVKAGRRTEAERRARTLASLARTLAELRRLRAEEHKVKPQDDDDGPRDINEFRLVLFKKLDRLVAEAKTLHPREADEEGDRGHHLMVEAVRAPPPDTAE